MTAETAKWAERVVIAIWPARLEARCVRPRLPLESITRPVIVGALEMTRRTLSASAGERREAGERVVWAACHKERLTRRVSVPSESVPGHRLVS